MNVAQTQTTIQFDTALRTLAHAATTRYAGEQARIDRGLCLALNGHVTLHEDGTASVTSATDREIVYHVAHDACDCPDFTRAPDGRCKHRWAACLVKRAHAAAVQADIETIDRLRGMCETVLERIEDAKLLLAQTPESTPPARYYATYSTPDGTDHQGIAQYVDGRVWLWTAAEGDRCFVADETLVLGGNVQITDAKRAEEEAQGGLVTIICHHNGARTK